MDRDGKLRQDGQTLEAASGRSVEEPLVCSKLTPDFQPVFSRDGNLVVTVTGAGAARVWDVHEGHPTSSVLSHYGRVLATQHSATGAMARHRNRVASDLCLGC